jgi:hypothetical protein
LLLVAAQWRNFFRSGLSSKNGTLLNPFGPSAEQIVASLTRQHVDFSMKNWDVINGIL